MAGLTELEHMILGVVGMYGPCTGYRVRRIFLDSLSSHWSGSAGAIYPALRRLEKQRLIRSAADRSTKRRTRELSLTPGGKRAVGEWLHPPLDQSALMDLDPLRTRVRMLGLLPREQRRQFVAAAQEQLKALEEEARAVYQHAKREDDPFRTLVCKGALDALCTRVRWLRDVEQVVASGSD